MKKKKLRGTRCIQQNEHKLLIALILRVRHSVPPPSDQTESRERKHFGRHAYPIHITPFQTKHHSCYNTCSAARLSHHRPHRPLLPQNQYLTPHAQISSKKSVTGACPPHCPRIITTRTQTIRAHISNPRIRKKKKILYVAAASIALRYPSTQTFPTTIRSCEAAPVTDTPTSCVSSRERFT